MKYWNARYASSRTKALERPNRTASAAVPGGLPQVQLLVYGSHTLPTRELYHQGVEYERTDINEAFVYRLVEVMTKREPRGCMLCHD